MDWVKQTRGPPIVEMIVFVSCKGVRVFVMSRNALHASLALSPAVSSHSCRTYFSRGTSQTGHLMGRGGEICLVPKRGSQLRSISQLPHLTLLFLDNESALL